MAVGEFFWLRASESVYKSLKVVRGVYYIDTDPKKHRFFKDYHTQHIVHTGVIDSLPGNASLTLEDAIVFFLLRNSHSFMLNFFCCPFSHTLFLEIF